MSSVVNITFDERPFTLYLARLLKKVDDPADLFADIGEYVTETTKRRFETSTAPDGSRWAPNTEVTYLRYLGVFKGSYTKKGKLSSAGSGRVMSKKPLIGEGGFKSGLAGQICPYIGSNFVAVGSTKEYAATHQFGASQGQYGSTRRGAPIPWGDIPARPFLGLSTDDLACILEIVQGHLATD